MKNKDRPPTLPRDPVAKEALKAAYAAHAPPSQQPQQAAAAAPSSTAAAAAATTAPVAVTVPVTAPAPTGSGTGKRHVAKGTKDKEQSRKCRDPVLQDLGGTGAPPVCVCVCVTVSAWSRVRVVMGCGSADVLCVLFVKSYGALWDVCCVRKGCGGVDCGIRVRSGGRCCGRAMVRCRTRTLLRASLTACQMPDLQLARCSGGRPHARCRAKSWRWSTSIARGSGWRTPKTA